MDVDALATGLGFFVFNVTAMLDFDWDVAMWPEHQNVSVNSPILFLKTNVIIIITFPISPIGIGTNVFNVFPLYFVLICG